MASSDPQQNISKPGNDSEEEEEEYIPPIRPHRYIYKFHRVGSQSSENIVGPASSPAVSLQQHEVSHTSSFSSSHTTHSSTVMEHSLAASSQREAVSINSFQTMTADGATSLGELEAAKILATNVAQEQQPMIPSNVPSEFGISDAPLRAPSDEVATEPKKPETEIFHQEMTGNLNQETSHPTLPCDSIPQEANASGIDSLRASTEVKLEEVNVTQQLESAPSTAESIVLTHEKEISVNASPFVENQNVISGLTAEKIAVISGITNAESQTTESPLQSTIRVIGGLTGIGETIVNGVILDSISSIMQGTQQPPDAAPVEKLLTQEVAETLRPATETTPQIPSLVPDEVQSSDSIKQHLEPAENVVLEGEKAIELREVIAGVTADNVKILSTLSVETPITQAITEPYNIASEQPSRENATAEHGDNLKEVISGQTSTNQPIISGLSKTEPAAEIHQETLKLTTEMHLEPLVCVTQIISGITLDGAAIVSGLALSRPSGIGNAGNNAAFDTNVAANLAQHSAKTPIFAGLTNDGIGIISGMTTGHSSEFANIVNDELTSVVHLTDAALPQSLVGIVMGVTASGEQLLGGLAVSKFAEISNDAEKTELSSNIEIALKKGSEVSHALTHTNGTGQPQANGDNLKLDDRWAADGQGHLDPFNLFPTGVPPRSDSY